jgi:hypothetical protein
MQSRGRPIAESRPGRNVRTCQIFVWSRRGLFGWIGSHQSGFWRSGVDRRVGGAEAVYVREPEEPTDAVQHRVDRGVPQPSLVKVADVQLEVGTLQSDQWLQAVGLAPGEPASQLVGAQPVVAPACRARYETATSCAGVMASGSNGRSVALVLAASDDLETMAWSRTVAHGEVT